MYQSNQSETTILQKNKDQHNENMFKTYNTLRLHLEPDRKLLWLEMLHPERPSFTIEMLQELLDVFQWIRSLHHNANRYGTPPIKYVVSTSALSSIFNWGGDLPLFVELIRKKEKDLLKYYAELCIDGQYNTYQSYGLPIINIALLEGNALGGGLEYALTHDMIIAENQVKIGLPEAKFNLFAGMGAYSILSRKLNFSKLQNMLISGELITAQDGKELGLINEISSENQGKQKVYEVIDKIDSSFHQKVAHYNAIRKIHAISKEEMQRIADYWVDCALKLTPVDLRKMTTLGLAQDRKMQQSKNSNGASSDYVLPNTAKEAQRLKDQASEFKQVTENQLELCDLKSGMSCLDIGCGAGDVMEIMGGYVGKEGLVVGMDINHNLGASVVKQLNKKNNCNYEFIHSDIMDTGFSSQRTYDLVFARFLLLHLSDPTLALKRMYTLVKPGGNLLLMDYDFRTMDSFPKMPAITELTRVIKEVFSKAGLDPNLGHKLPRYMEKAGLGSPDHINVYDGIKPVAEVVHVLRATFESFLPMGKNSVFVMMKVMKNSTEQ